MTTRRQRGGHQPPLRGAARRWPSLFNPPGRSALHFRLGDHGEFFSRMEGRLLERFPDLQRAMTVHTDGTWYHRGNEDQIIHGRLRDLRSAVPLHAVLEVWAEVLDILSFYQERYLQEGFVRTATEPRSLKELWRMVGYSGSPPIAGTADVAVLLDALGGVPKTLRVSDGLEIQGEPLEGDTPLVFETLENASFHFTKNRRVLQGSQEMVASTHLAFPGYTPTQTTSLWLEGNPAVGDGLLLFGRLQGNNVPWRWFGHIQEVVTSETYPNHVLVTWSGPPAAPSGTPRNLDPNPDTLDIYRAMVQRQGVPLFGAEAPRFEDLPIEEQRTYWPITGGVQLLDAEVSRPINGSGPTGLPQVEVRDLLWVGGALLAATADGLMRTEDGGTTWRSLDLRFGMGPMRCVSALGSTVFAGADDGKIFRSRDGGVTWDPLGVQGVPLPQRNALRSKVLASLDGKTPHTILPRLHGRRLEVVVGTSEGVFWSHETAAGWRSMSRGLPGFDAESGSATVTVYDVIPGPRRGQLLAATSSGVYGWRPTLKRWRPHNLGLPCTDPVTGASQTEAFALERMHGRYVVGTQEGLFGADPTGKRWEHALLDTAAPWGAAVRHLALGGVRGFETLFAGSDVGLFESLDEGVSWHRRVLGKGSEGPILALAGAETPALATAWGDLLGSEWPGFRLHNGVIDLAATVPGVLPGGWVVLYQDDGVDSRVEALEILEVDEIERRDFDLQSRISRLQVDPTVDLAPFDLRRTTAWVKSRPLGLADLQRRRWVEQVSALAAALDSWAEELVLVEVADPWLALLLFSNDPGPQGANHDALMDELALWRLAAPWLRPLPASQLASRLRKTDRRYEELMALDTWPVDLLKHLLATLGVPDEDSPWHGDWDLETLVDPDREPCLRIFGNTAAVVEGNTHRGEVLGSAKADQPFQRFILPSPLVWRQEKGFLRPDLWVHIDQELWIPVRSFEAQGPDDRVFMLRRTVEGHDEIVFGDGFRGALPPAGYDNVIATYRSGSAGQTVPARALTSLPRRPLGMSEIFNPYAGRRGRPTDVPRNDPLAGALRTRSCDRIVSLTDYVDFVAGQPGVVRCLARLESNAGRSPTVHLWVGWKGTFSTFRHPERIADRLRRLRRRIQVHQQVDFPVYLQEIVSCPVAFDARVHGTWDPERDLVELEHKIWWALQQRFGHRHHAIGKPISQSAVMRVLQLPEGVHGIERVELTAFKTPQTEAGSEEVRAHELYWLRRGACNLELVPRSPVSTRFGEVL